MKVDFIHVGGHKTASSWLQIHVFRAHPDIEIVNDALTPYRELFLDSFIDLGEFDFSLEEFRRKFWDRRLAEKPLAPGKIYGISEENLSGHYWLGCGGALSAERLRQAFGPTKIIFFVREQRDMMRSLYSQYLKAGGTKSLQGLLDEEASWGSRVYSKLHYDGQAAHYDKLFSRENVLVLPYEALRSNPQAVLDRFFSFIGAPAFVLPPSLLKTKSNLGLSAPGELMMRGASRLVGDNARLRGLIEAFDEKLIAPFVKPKSIGSDGVLSPDQIRLWRESNRRLQDRMGIDLAALGYLE